MNILAEQGKNRTGKKSPAENQETEKRKRGRDNNNEQFTEAKGLSQEKHEPRRKKTLPKL